MFAIRDGGNDVFFVLVGLWWALHAPLEGAVRGFRMALPVTEGRSQPRPTQWDERQIDYEEGRPEEAPKPVFYCFGCRSGTPLSPAVSECPVSH